MSVVFKSISRLIGDNRGQSTVEAAVCLPVAIVVGLVVFNMLRFASLCARFDRVSLDTVVSQGVSPSGQNASGSASALVYQALAQAMGLEEGDKGVQIEVFEAPAGVSIHSEFVCVLSVRPWPSSLAVAGVRYEAPSFLQHERRFTVARYRPGIVLKKE